MRLFLLVLTILSVELSAFAVGENMINTAAGKSYAGFGYTHGYIPVTDTTDNASIFDNDIMRYDVNSSKPAQNYYNQEDLKQHYGNQAKSVGQDY